MHAKRSPRSATPARPSTARRARPVGTGHADSHIKQLLAELQLHQIELETQNEELRRVRDELAESLRRYTELYDQAPVGYMTLDGRGRITQFNRAAGALLGLEPDAPLPMVLSKFLSRAAIASWRARFEDALRSGGSSAFELEVRSLASGDRRQVHVDLSADAEARTLRVMLSDVTDLRDLERAARDAVLKEHERISADIHDGLGQELTGLSMTLQALRKKSDAGASTTAAEFAVLSDITARAIASCRSIVRGLSPVGENEGGLITALRRLVERVNASGGVQIRLRATGRAKVHVPLATSDHLFRIAQEALTNARKHSGATHIEFSVDVQSAAITLQVTDDGKGCGEGAGSREGLGLRLMSFRAASIHAQFSRDDVPGGGTRISCVCPQSAAMG